MSPFINIPGFRLGTYGVLVVSGFVAAFITIMILQKQKGRADYPDGTDIFLYGIAFAVAGAVLFRTLTKLPSVLVHIEYWKQETVEHFFSYLFGEYVFYGGLLGGLLGVIIFTGKYRLPTLRYLDLFAAPVAFAHAIGRIGCYFGGCCYGIPVDANHPLAVIYPDNSFAAPGGIPLFNIPVTESVFLAVLGIILVAVFVKGKQDGRCVLLYLCTYSVWRFVAEFYRGDLVRGKLGIFSTSQYVSLAIFAGVILFIANQRFHGKRGSHRI